MLSTIFGPYTSNAQDTNNWSGYTTRLILPVSALLASASVIRVHLAYYNANWSFHKCYIGQAKSSSDVYDFVSTPKQVLFNGSASGTVTSGGLGSDPLIYSLNNNYPILISLYLNSAAVVSSFSSSYGCAMYYKSGDDAATVDTSSYTSFGSYLRFIDAIYEGVTPNNFYARRSRMILKGISMPKVKSLTSLSTMYVFNHVTSFESNDAGYNGYTARVIIPAAQLLIDCSDGFRLMVTKSNVPFGFAKCYVGHAASSGDAYDFESTPVQVFWNGVAGASVTGDDVTSDLITYTIDKTKNLVVSFYFSSTTYDDIPVKSGTTGYGFYYKSGDDAATVNATGYTNQATTLRCISGIIANQVRECFIHSRRERVCANGISTNNQLL